MSFEAHDYPAYQLFTRRCYGTPRNQRQYVWNRRNWQELFDDVILVATQKEPTHFIGSIVLYREKDRKNGVSYFTIVDGQQRIGTLIQNARKSNSENSEPDFQQLSLF